MIQNCYLIHGPYSDFFNCPFSIIYGHFEPIMITFSFCVSFIFLNLETNLSISLSFMTFIVLKKYGPFILFNLALSDISLWLDLGYTFWLGIPLKWCWVLLSALTLGGNDIIGSIIGRINFDHFVKVMSSRFLQWIIICSIIYFDVHLSQIWPMGASSSHSLVLLTYPRHFFKHLISGTTWCSRFILYFF